MTVLLLSYHRFMVEAVRRCEEVRIFLQLHKLPSITPLYIYYLTMKMIRVHKQSRDRSPNYHKRCPRPRLRRVKYFFLLFPGSKTPRYDAVNSSRCAGFKLCTFVHELMNEIYDLRVTSWCTSEGCAYFSRVFSAPRLCHNCTVLSLTCWPTR